MQLGYEVSKHKDYEELGTKKNQSNLTIYALIVLSLVGWSLFVVFVILWNRGHSNNSGFTSPATFKPPAIHVGDTVGFITPASPVVGIWPNLTSYQQHVQQIMSDPLLQFKVVFAPHALSEDPYGYLAASDQDRANDVMDMFNRDDIKLIIANRGGWGCNRFVNLLDFQLISSKPKVIMGYSDLTGLLNAITASTGMITMHGPMGVDDWSNGVNAQYIHQVLIQGQAVVYSNNAQYSDVFTITSGKAKGTLIGGNLSVFSALSGSNYVNLGRFGEAILFLEEVGEFPYSIDRMLTELYLAQELFPIAGFVWGRCASCAPPPPNPGATGNWTWQDVVVQRIQPLNIPSYYGAMFGHDMSGQFIMPIGADVEIDADAHTITLLDSVVQM